MSKETKKDILQWYKGQSIRKTLLLETSMSLTPESQNTGSKNWQNWKDKEKLVYWKDQQSWQNFSYIDKEKNEEIIIGNLNITLSIISITNRQIKEEIEDLENTVIWLYLTDVSITLYPRRAGYIFSSA